MTLHGRDEYDLLFDPDVPGCLPYAVCDDDGVPDLRYEGTMGNVVQWRFDYFGPRPICGEAWL